MRVLETNHTEATEAIGEAIGSQLKGGEVIELISDLGGGKTAFVRGLARGAGSEDHVSSPTFTVSKVYQASHCTIHHFDFYRLPEAGVVQFELAEVVGDPQAVVVAEWAGGVESVMPTNRLTVRINVLPDDRRRVQLDCTPELEYLVKTVPTVPHPTQDNT